MNLKEIRVGGNLKSTQIYMVKVPLKFLKSFSKHSIRGVMNGILYDNMCEHIMYGVQTVTALLKHALPFS